VGNLSDLNCIGVPFEENGVYLVVNHFDFVHGVTNAAISLGPDFKCVNFNHFVKTPNLDQTIQTGRDNISIAELAGVETGNGLGVRLKTVLEVFLFGLLVPFVDLDAAHRR